MPYQKIYSRINWENYPSDATPLNENNLNKLDVAADEIDNRVIGLDTTKLDKITGATMVKDVSYDPGSGIFTVKYLNGTAYNLDTKLEKLAVNFAYDYRTQQLIITLDDGTKQYVDMSALITQYEFTDTDTIDLVIDGTGKVSAMVKDGSIGEHHLRPDYLADIRVEMAKAQASQTAAAASESAARTSETNAKSYAEGGTGTRPGEDEANAKYYMEQAKKQTGGIPTKLSELENDTEFVTASVDNLINYYEKSDVYTSTEVDDKLSGYLATTGDAGETTVTFKEATDLAELASGEKQSTLFGKLKLTVKNVISILKLLGSTDISGIGDGTVTGAISGLNSNLSQLPQKIIHGTALCNIDSAGVIRIPISGMTDGTVSLTVKEANFQIANSGYDQINKYIFAALRSDLGASYPTSGAVWVDYIMVGR